MGRMTKVYSKLIKRSFNQRFFMARMTKVPVLGRAMEFAFFENDDIIILPKDEIAAKAIPVSRTIDVNISAQPTNVVLPSQAIEHFIQKSRYIYLMNKCMCRDSNHCQHYPAELGCIFLGRGVLKIPEGMGRMVTKEEALEHLGRCREAGLVHLIGRDKIDSVWLGTGSKENLLSICSCCDCCCLWKMLPELNQSINATVTRMPGVKVGVDRDRCIGCQACVKQNICYVRAISMHDGKASINDALCKGCARCVQFCAEKAIDLHIEDSEFMRRTIERIEPLVDVTSE
jgi:Pyruvate/2-oxoacid:ferredoxin oxidoreductase delta subunit